jgi:hypothetical protein
VLVIRKMLFVKLWVVSVRPWDWDLLFVVRINVLLFVLNYKLLSVSCSTVTCCELVIDCLVFPFVCSHFYVHVLSACHVVLVYSSARNYEVKCLK